MAEQLRNGDSSVYPEKITDLQFGRLLSSVEHLNENVERLTDEVKQMHEEIRNKPDKETVQRIVQDELREVGVDVRDPDRSRQDLEWLRKARQDSEQRSIYKTHAGKALAAAAAIAICALVWNATTDYIVEQLQREQEQHP